MAEKDAKSSKKAKATKAEKAKDEIQETPQEVPAEAPKKETSVGPRMRNTQCGIRNRGSVTTADIFACLPPRCILWHSPFPIALSSFRIRLATVGTCISFRR